MEGLSGANESALYFKRSWAPRFNGSTGYVYPATDATASEDNPTDITDQNIAADAAATAHVAAGFAAMSSSSILVKKWQSCSAPPPRPSWFRPLPFSTLQRYFPPQGRKLPYVERPFSVACVLRPHTALHFDPSRTRILRCFECACMKLCSLFLR